MWKGLNVVKNSLGSGQVNLKRSACSCVVGKPGEVAKLFRGKRISSKNLGFLETLELEVINLKL